jgi:hypothetical protein
MVKLRIRVLFATLAAGLLAAPLLTASAAPQDKAETKAKAVEETQAPRIQLAILLDTSGSMQGLINQTRTQLWKIVNELATAEQNGKVPNLEVALYEYGKSSLPKQDGYLRMIVPLSDDLDKLSEELFALSTNGGQEYCGQTIMEATKNLKWSDSESDLKLIYIAGNEPFNQGSVNYQDACKAAIEKGITVNTIFCGPEAEGIRTSWQAGAQLADGSFLSIDQNRQVAAIKTPFDKKLATLSSAVNKTYVTYGKAEKRQNAARRQVAADSAAKSAAPAAAAERAAFKGRSQYRAAADLLDALKGGKVKLKDIKDEELPKELQKKSLAEKKTIIEAKGKERVRIQNELRSLADQRKKYIAAERKKQATGEKGDTLDGAIIKSVRAQAARKKFKFQEEN